MTLLAFASAACRGQSRGAAEDAVLARLVDSLRVPVERAAGLTFRTPPRSALRSREEVRAYLVAKLDEELPPARMRGLETALSPVRDAARHAGAPEAAAGSVHRAGGGLLRSRLGDPVRRGRGGPGQLRLVLAHEMVHALQGQYLPLDSILKATANNDRLTAAQSILEGQATLASIEVLAPGQGIDRRRPSSGRCTATRCGRSSRRCRSSRARRWWCGRR